MTRYSVPAKTFLVGEYVALDGGPSIIVNTNPRFELVLQPANIGAAGSGSALFVGSSPAGRYIAKYPDAFDGQDAEFIDPFQGKGGLGASSAQFALACAAHKEWKSLDPSTFDWSELLTEYRSCAWNGVGTPPSGADVVAQLTGGITYFDARGSTAGQLEWNFPKLGFTLFRTGSKLPTHEHLKEKNQAPIEALRTLVIEAKRAFDTGSEKLLIDTVHAYGTVLADAGLTADRTTALLNGMKTKKELFHAVKGCGAMGADVIVAIHDRDLAEDVEIWAEQENLEVCGSLDELSEGLQVIAS
jgi:mevalonate kinase